MNAELAECRIDVFAELSPPYSTIVADPPWHYENFAGSRGRGGVYSGHDERVAVQKKPMSYSSLSVDEIAELPVAALAGHDAWLWLWATNRYLQDAFTIGESWGFGYRQLIVWSKTGNPSPFGGTVAPPHAEFLLLFAKGSPPVKGRVASSVLEAPKQSTHSVKPGVFLDVVEATTPGPYVELFARAPRLGWDSWGHGYEIGATPFTVEESK
jgi:N6-adenosine-specific RNA methylase IME4